ncbi:MAG TPA: hypothetical protein VGR85_15625 [Candidatus Limnocylindria bacterium]|nr:hypothetical protein [Candidatus Limnocylindria bacterium]
MKRSYTVELRSAPIPDGVGDDLVARFGDAVLSDRRLAGPVAGADSALQSLEVRTSVDATSLASAITVAEAAFVRAIRRARVTAELALITAWADVDGVDEPDKLVNAGEVAERLSISRERVRQLVSERPSRFPRPLIETERDRFWRLGDIVTWARLHERKVGRPKKRTA